MKSLLLVFLVLIFVLSNSFAVTVIVQKDNGSPFQGAYTGREGWEESVLLTPEGPCNITEIQIYFAGTQAGLDTIYIVGDPSEGSIPPTFWVLEYNQKIPPIIVNYDGTPGWKNFSVTGLRSDGYDRICIQHNINGGGPYFAYDNNGAGTPYTSFLLDPNTMNSLGIPGTYYLANGDFLIRLKVEYDYPDGNRSSPPPVPLIVNVSKSAGLVSNGSMINATDVSVADWNNDGFDDIAVASMYFQNNKNGTFTNVSSQINVPAGTTSWADYDNDGDLDIYSVTNGGWDDNLKIMFSTNKLYKNDGNGSFSQIDNKNLFKLPYPQPSEDFNLPNKYVQDSIHNPYPCITANWSDFNEDGILDLFLANNRVGLNDQQGNYVERYLPDQLWLSNQDGTLSNKTTESGMVLAETFSSQSSWFGYHDCYGAVSNDYNQDGNVDIFVATYRLVRDILYRGNGEGKMQDVASVVGVRGVLTPSRNPQYYGHGMGCQWADFNNDALPDLMVGNLGHPDQRGQFANPSLLFRNEGSPAFNFTETHIQLGIKFFEMNAGMMWADLDLDGYQDVWHGQIAYEAEGTNGAPKRFGRIYMNQGPPDYKFKESTWNMGQDARVHGCWAAGRIDYDHDGDIDLLVASNFEGLKLFRNDMAHKGAWLELKLKGSPANKINMDAFGTRVIAYAGGQKFYRDLMGSAAGTKGTQNSNELHFGFGEINKLDSVVVIYKNDKSKTYTNLKLNSRYEIPYLDNEKMLSLATPALQEPANFSTLSAGSVDLIWNPVGGAESYILQVSTNADFSGAIDMPSGTSTSAKYNVSNNVTIYWRVKALKGEDVSPWSSVWVLSAGYSAPLKVRLSRPVNDSINVSALPYFIWTKADLGNFYADQNITYNLEIASDADFINLVKNKSAITSPEYQLNELLSPNSIYYWRVCAVNLGVAGEWSEVWKFRTLSAPGKLTLISPANDEKDVALKPSMKWNALGEASKYVVQISENIDFTDIYYQNEGIQNPYFKLFKSLEEGTDYYWHVAGINDGGRGAWSDTWKFTTTGIKNVEQLSAIASDLKLKCTPNPFTNIVNVEYSLPSYSNLKIEVLDIEGKIIETIFEAVSNEGTFKTVWNSESYPDGMYFIRISDGRNSVVEKIVKNK